MTDVDMPLTEITGAKRLAAAMIDTALRRAVRVDGRGISTRT
jgi:hypothetical protein